MQLPKNVCLYHLWLTCDWLRERLALSDQVSSTVFALTLYLASITVKLDFASCVSFNTR